MYEEADDPCYHKLETGVHANLHRALARILQGVGGTHGIGEAHEWDDGMV